MNKARLTYRIDPTAEPRKPGGKPQNVIPLYEEEFHIVRDPKRQEEQEELEEERRTEMETSPFSAWRDPLAIDPLTNDYGAWQTPIDLEADRVERAIRESERRRQPETDHRQEPPFRDAGRPGNGYEGPELSYTTRTRTPNTPWMKLSASIAGAAVTGVVLGFFVLQMFSGSGAKDTIDQTNPITNALTKASGQKSPQAAVQPAAQPVSAAVSGTQGTAIGLAGQTYTLLQGGSFSTQQAAETQVADLRKKGYAAVIEPGDKFNVYVGMAVNKDNALGLSSMLKQQKIDVYMKAYALPAVSSVKWSGKTDALKTYLTDTNRLIGTISALSLMHLEEAKPTGLDKSTADSLKSSHEAWSAAAAALDQEAPADSKETLQKIANAINSAKKSMDEYQKNPSAAMLWNAQYSLLQGTLAQKDLLTAIAVN